MTDTRSCCDDDFTGEDGLPISALGMYNGTMETSGPMSQASLDVELLALSGLMNTGPLVQHPIDAAITQADANKAIDDMLTALEAGSAQDCPICGNRWKTRNGKHGVFWFCGNGHTFSRSSVERSRT